MTDVDHVDVDELERLLLLEDEIGEEVPSASTSNTAKISDNEDKAKLKSLIHSGDTDSSDDDEEKNCLESRYNEYGRDILTMLKAKQQLSREAQIEREIEQAARDDDAALKEERANAIKNFIKEMDETEWQAEVEKQEEIVKKKTSSIKEKAADIRNSNGWTSSPVYVDPVFGMRIIKPLVSSTVLKEKMEGRKPVSILHLANFLNTSSMKEDWVVAGAIVSKLPVKKSQKGTTYSVWKVSDLRGEIKTMSLFLFKNAHKELWKTHEGTIIAILNPSVLENRDSRDVASLSVDTEQRVMILGQSKDMGKCRARKKNGEPCTAIVNQSACDYCIYHVKQEYSKASKRSEFQSGTTGSGLNDLRNKVLGKDQVFYAGQMFTAIKATKNAKQVAKDQNRLLQLSEYYQSPLNGQSSRVNSSPSNSNQRKEVSASKIEGTAKQRHKDLERLSKLGGDISTLSPTSILPPVLSSKTSATPSSSNSPASNSTLFSFDKKPQLSRDSFSIDLSTPSEKSAALSKARAIEILKKKPIEKSNPNFIKHRGTEIGKKRALAEMTKNETTDGGGGGSEGEPDAKKKKIDADKKEWEERIRKIMEKKSSHVDLLEERENEEQEKYFTNLEKKEAMEEKMLNTFKVACKAVICSKCKYIAFSAADKCKAEKHPLRVVDGEKRFFKCLDCGNRTTTLFRIPKISCKNCQSSRWERTSMMREKKVGVGCELSIRGDEEKYVGSVNVKGGNINLLVPEEFV